MQIYGLELLAVCSHPDKFGDQRQSNSQKGEFSIKNKNIASTENWVASISTGQEKNVTTLKLYILRKMAQMLKSIFIVHFMTTFYNFALKTKPVELSWWLNHFQKQK